MVWIVAHMDAHGRPPSVRELAAGLGMRSTRSAVDHLIRLHALGAIQRTPNTARGISVPDPALPDAAAGQGGTSRVRLRVRVCGACPPYRVDHGCGPASRGRGSV